MWKIAVEHHAFFRLREPEKPKKQILPSFNPRFRYTGQSTYIQSRYRSVERQQPAFERSLSKRLTQSMDRGLSSTTFQRPNINSKSIPDKINMSEDEEVYVTNEIQSSSVKQDHRKPSSIAQDTSVNTDFTKKELARNAFLSQKERSQVLEYDENPVSIHYYSVESRTQQHEVIFETQMLPYGLISSGFCRMKQAKIVKEIGAYFTELKFF